MAKELTCNEISSIIKNLEMQHAILLDKLQATENNIVVCYGILERMIEETLQEGDSLISSANQ